jgi:hypothetical protein
LLRTELISLETEGLNNDNIQNEKIDIEVPIDASLSGGNFSFNKLPTTTTTKPLEQWTPNDFVLNACIYCMNNGGNKGPPIMTSEQYETHIVNKHKPGTPAYPGPADIEKYNLKLPNEEARD